MADIVSLRANHWMQVEKEIRLQVLRRAELVSRTVGRVVRVRVRLKHGEAGTEFNVMQKR